MSSQRTVNYFFYFLVLTDIVCVQERVQMNKILSNALEWGVKILYVDGMSSRLFHCLNYYLYYFDFLLWYLFFDLT